MTQTSIETKFAKRYTNEKLKSQIQKRCVPAQTRTHSHTKPENNNRKFNGVESVGNEARCV